LLTKRDFTMQLYIISTKRASFSKHFVVCMLMVSYFWKIIINMF